MVWFFLIPSIPNTFGNFLIPLMIGARDLAFPRLNLLSWYIYILGGLFTVYVLISGGVDTGWTFYTPLSSMFANGKVVLAATAIFIVGFSSILTGLNFIVTIHKLRCSGHDAGDGCRSSSGRITRPRSSWCWRRRSCRSRWC